MHEDREMANRYSLSSYSRWVPNHTALSEIEELPYPGKVSHSSSFYGLSTKRLCAHIANNAIRKMVDGKKGGRLLKKVKQFTLKDFSLANLLRRPNLIYESLNYPNLPLTCVLSICICVLIICI